MAARRNGRKNGNGKRKGIGNMIWKVARELATPISFLDQISRKDRETMGDAFNNAPVTQKLKILANIVTGRTTGINLFSDEVQAPQTINFSGIFNRWTALGIGMSIYGFVAKGVTINGVKILPHGSKLSQLGTRLLTGGAFGGIFDAPGDGSKPAQAQGTRNIQLDSPNTNNQIVFKNTNIPTGRSLVMNSAQRSL